MYKAVSSPQSYWLTQQQQPVQTTNTAETRTSPKKSGGSGGSDLEKKLNESLGNIKGLPSDVAELTGKLSDVYNQGNLYDSEGNLNVTNAQQAYLGILNGISRAAHSKAIYDKAYSAAEKNNSLNEFAITSGGQVVVMDPDTGQLTYKSPQDLLKEDNKYAPVTNATLLKWRAENYAFSDELIGVVENGIGYEQVTDMILKAVNNLGTNSDLKQGIDVVASAFQESDETGETVKSIQQLKDMKLLNKTQVEQANKAMNYLWLTLPQNARTLLKLKSDGTEEGALSLIQNLVFSRTTTQAEIVTTRKDDDKTDSKNNKTNSGGGDPAQDLTIDWMQQMFLGNDRDVSIPITPGSNLTLHVKGMKVSPKDDQGHSLDTRMSYKKMLESTHLSDVVQTDVIWFGGQKVQRASTEAGQWIMVDDPQNATLVHLPVDAEGNPILNSEEDAKLEDQLNTVRNAIKAAKAQGMQVTPKTVQALLDSKGINVKVSEDGSFMIDNRAYKPFLIMNGAAACEHTVGEEQRNTWDNSPYLQQTGSDENNAYLQELKTQSGDKLEIDEDNWYEWLGNYDHVYRGLIIMKVDGTMQSASAALKTLPKADTYEGVKVKEQQKNHENAILNGAKQYNITDKVVE